MISSIRLFLDIVMRAGMFSLLVLISMSIYAISDADRDEIEQRISPVGHVNVQKSAVQPSAATTPGPEKQIVAKKATGQSIYEQYCIVCHRDGLVGAPKFRNEEDWKPRQAIQNIDSLTATALKGLNAMPAKGTCQECSEADMKAAIKYMVPQS